MTRCSTRYRHERRLGRQGKALCKHLQDKMKALGARVRAGGRATGDDTVTWFLSFTSAPLFASTTPGRVVRRRAGPCPAAVRAAPPERPHHEVPGRRVGTSCRLVGAPVSASIPPDARAKRASNSWRSSPRRVGAVKRVLDMEGERIWPRCPRPASRSCSMSAHLISTIELSRRIARWGSRGGPSPSSWAVRRLDATVKQSRTGYGRYPR